MSVPAVLFTLVGAALMVLAAVGIVRLPDVYSRMHAATKAASLGIACLLAGAAISIDGGLASLKLMVAAAVQLLAAPAAAHALGRAAYRAGAPTWPGTRRYDLGDSDRPDTGPGANSE